MINRDYREKKIMGMLTISEGMQMGMVPVTVRMTSDSKGQSLSLSAYEEIMISIPLESVRDIIQVTRRNS